MAASCHTRRGPLALAGSGGSPDTYMSRRTVLRLLAPLRAAAVTVAAVSVALVPIGSAGQRLDASAGGQWGRIPTQVPSPQLQQQEVQEHLHPFSLLQNDLEMQQFQQLQPQLPPPQQFQAPRQLFQQLPQNFQQKNPQEEFLRAQQSQNLLPTTQQSTVPEQFLQQQPWQAPVQISREETLLAENRELKQEIQRWRVAAAHVAQREALAAATLQQWRKGDRGSAAPAIAAAPVVTTPKVSLAAGLVSAESTAEAAAKLAARYTQSGMPNHVHLGVLVFVCIFCIGGLALRSVLAPTANSAKAKKAVPMPTVTGSVQRGTWLPPAVGGAVRRFAGKDCQVEVSEIHVGGLPVVAGDLHMSLTGDRGQAWSTRVVRQANGSFLKFSESFVFAVGTSAFGSDGPLALAVCSGQKVLAFTEIPAKELSALACRKHREFHRAQLTLTASAAQGSAQEAYVAMRIREVDPAAGVCA